MKIADLTSTFAVAPQVGVEDVEAIAKLGFRSIIANRPDGEAKDQPSAEEIRTAAERYGLNFGYIPVIPGRIGSDDVARFNQLRQRLEGPVLAYCRTGTRSISLWALGEAERLSAGTILQTASDLGYDLSSLRQRLEEQHRSARSAHGTPHDIVIVGGGAAGIAVAASLLKRRPGLDIIIVEPSETHQYQPGLTMVGGGVFDAARTRRPTADILPRGVRWKRAAAKGFSPAGNEVLLDDGSSLSYRVLIAAPGISLDWEAVDGLEGTLGRNGVTSNYRPDLASYTWDLIRNLGEGHAIFTQPPLPIKCAGAPQKAMYLACDHWRRRGRLGNIEIAFHNAGGVLFGVSQYVPALMDYVARYSIGLNFGSNLVAVDGPARRATFRQPEGEVTRSFDLLHVCPPQKAPPFIAQSPLAGDAGYVDVDQHTLRHNRFENIFGLGDGCSAPNAKTAAAARKQAPVVAANALSILDGRDPQAAYDGYGSCPLTVERGKIVLAEFGYGGALQPSFPEWLIDGTRPSRLSWQLKEKLLPWIYWNAMLKGREWLAAPAALVRSGHRDR